MRVWAINYDDCCNTQEAVMPLQASLSHLIFVKHTDRFDIPKARLIYDNMDSLRHYTEQPTPNKHTQMQICLSIMKITVISRKNSLPRIAHKTNL